MIIDFDGNELNRKRFVSLLFGSYQQIIPSKIQLNINREKGFLRYSRSRSNSTQNTYTLVTTLNLYVINPNGTFTIMASRDYFGQDLIISTIISTVNEGYAFVYVKKIHTFTETEPFIPQIGLFVSFNQYEQMLLSSTDLLLYQTPFPNVTFPALSCDVSFFYPSGHICVLTILQKDPDGDKIFYAKVEFLSSGSVTAFTAINNMIPNNVPNSNDLNIVWTVKSLFGGHMLTNTFKDNQGNCFIYGNVPFPDPVTTNLNGVFQVLPHNNTLLVAQMEKNNSWNFQVFDLPKFASDKGYLNPSIAATVPAIGSSIDPNILKISINFTVKEQQVELSNGNLSIYQVIGDQQYLRQLIPGILCSIDEIIEEVDGKLNYFTIVSGDVLKSTFSLFKGNYFIRMDNNFVRDRGTKESQLGIRENIWNFNTVEKEETFTSLTTGLLRLNSNGTLEFDKFFQEERNDFFKTLLDDLSIAIPINKSRLTTNKITQLDDSVNEKQYLISITIKAGNDNYANSVASIIDNIVRHKYQSPIISSQITSYLDESYGFKELREYLLIRTILYNMY
jgi:hypothetical protein